MKLREMKACFKPDILSDRDIVYRGLKIKYLKCVGNYRYSEWRALFGAYDYWKNTGLMPGGETHYNSPAKLIDVFSIIDSLVMDFKERRSRGK